jgi:hypothetical protein
MLVVCHYAVVMCLCCNNSNSLPWRGELNHQYPEHIFTIDTTEHTLGIFNEDTYSTVYLWYIHSLFIKDTLPNLSDQKKRWTE